MANVRKFAVTLNSTSREGKIEMRDRVFDIFCSLVESVDEKIAVLTLPSVYWLLEHRLLSHMKDNYSHSNKFLSLHAFEYDWKIFSYISLNVPKNFYSTIRQQMSERMNYQKIQTKHFGSLITVHNIDVFSYLEQSPNMFHLMWLDLTCNLDTISDRLHSISEKLDTNGIAVLSFVKGRERKIKCDRVQYVLDKLPDMELIEVIEYMDTTPMINMFLKKKCIISEDLVD